MNKIAAADFNRWISLILLHDKQPNKDFYPNTTQEEKKCERSAVAACIH